MQSDTFRCSHPDICRRWYSELLALGPVPTRLEYEVDSFLIDLSGLYADVHGEDLISRLEQLTSEFPEFPILSRMPTLGELQAAIEGAYVNNQLDDLHRLLRAFVFYWNGSSRSLANRLQPLAARVKTSLAARAKLSFCGACGDVQNVATPSCPKCGSATVELLSCEVGRESREGLRLHVPSEIYAANALKTAGYHLLRVGPDRARSGISLTFTAFGVKVDVDALGLGHPSCLLFLLVTTARIDQNKAMLMKGTVENLIRFVRQRMKDAPPIHVAVVAMGEIDGNLDLLGLEKTGMTVVPRDRTSELARELGRIPARLTVERDRE